MVPCGQWETRETFESEDGHALLVSLQRHSRRQVALTTAAIRRKPRRRTIPPLPSPKLHLSHLIANVTLFSLPSITRAHLPIPLRLPCKAKPSRGKRQGNASSRNQVLPRQTKTQPGQTHNHPHRTMAAGDDLLQYLIVPTGASPYPSASASNSDTTPEASRGPHQSVGESSSSTTRAEKTPPAKRSRMEVDTQPGALPGQILSMEEFMTQRRLSEQAVARPQAQPQPAPEPRIISARSSKNTIELHEKYQALGIPRPEFVFQGGSVEGWVVKTLFLGRELSVQEACGSKQEAKEKLSEICLKVVKEMEEAGQLAKTPRAKKMKKGGEEPPTAQTEKESNINYIGQLLGTSPSNIHVSLFLPTYVSTANLSTPRIPTQHQHPPTHLHRLPTRAVLLLRGDARHSPPPLRLAHHLLHLQARRPPPRRRLRSQALPIRRHVAHRVHRGGRHPEEEGFDSQPLHRVSLSKPRSNRPHGNRYGDPILRPPRRDSLVPPLPPHARVAVFPRPVPRPGVPHGGLLLPGRGTA